MTGPAGSPSAPPVAGPAGPAGPGGAAPVTGASDLVRAFVRSPFEPETWLATAAIVLGIGIAVFALGLLSFLFSTGGSLLIWLVGIPIIALGLELSRGVAVVERWRMRIVDTRPLVPHPYRPLGWPPAAPYGAWIRAWAEAEFLDANRWRDVVYVLILLPLSVVEFIVSIGLWIVAAAFILAPLAYAALRVANVQGLGHGPASEWVGGAVVVVIVGVVLVPVASVVARGFMMLHRAVVQGLLCVDPADALRRDVERLRGSRSAALELEASELRRIERDLHDGAQQRLVSLAIDLGRAEERIDTDPAAAKAIVADARAQARLALAELRDLVRGTMPSILVDRGLEAALAAVAARCPVPTVLDASLGSGDRPPAAVERAAYFVVVEALANVAKHSRATRCEVVVRREPGRLTIEVRDDGVGGATMAPGGGLGGLRDRAQALDGSITVSSPPGGPTVVHVELPLGPDATAPQPPPPPPAPGQPSASR